MIAQHSATRNLSDLAGRAISQTMAMVFVDLMRLLYVASAERAHAANVDRYDEFTDFADQHFGDLRSRIATYSSALDPLSHEEISQLELRLSWLLGRLKRKRRSGHSYEQYFKKMREVGDALHHFCQVNAAEQYQNRYEKAETEIKSRLERLPVNLNSIDDLFQLRLETQNGLLKAMRESERVQIFSIADDMDQNLAIVYFTIDYLLLTMRVVG